MPDLTQRNLELTCSALDRADIYYFTAEQKLIVYVPCKAEPKHRTLRPTTLHITITPTELGILFDAGLPVALAVKDADERHLILRQIAKENFGTIRGCLTLDENDRMHYRLFYILDEEAANFDAVEITSCIKLCGSSLS